MKCVSKDVIQYVDPDVDLTSFRIEKLFFIFLSSENKKPKSSNSIVERISWSLK